MILPDHHIRNACRDQGVITPWSPEYIQPASYELHLAPTVRLMWIEGHPEADVGLMVMGLLLQPDQFLLAHTVETVKLPSHLAAQVSGKSSLGRLGLVVHKTAGWIDPGFEGTIVLEMRNFGHEPIVLSPYMPIAQLIFMRLVSPCERPYGSDGLGSHYQGQTGVTPSWLGQPEVTP